LITDEGEGEMTIYCGVDWSEHYHEVALVDDAGKVLATWRISDDAAGLTVLMTLLGEHTGAGEFVAVDVAIETGRGLLVAGLRAAGHQVFEINPKAVSRYRDRHAVSGAKSDPGDALVLAHLLRTDGHRHRPMPADSEQVAVVGVLARAHHDAITAALREAGRLRSLLREFYPAALAAFPTLHTVTATTVLAAAPTPTAAAQLTEDQLRKLLRSARYNTPRGQPAKLRAIFTVPALRQPPAIEAAMSQAVIAIVRTLSATLAAIRELEKALDEHFDAHPDAPILRSMPGLGLILGARILGEFGDDPTRFPDAASRRAYAGTAPITRASGKLKLVLLRRACNHRLAQTCRWWAFTATQRSPGAKAYYRARRNAGDSREAALRRLANKLLGQLHHCLVHRELYDERLAWPLPEGEATNIA
jgi:transposase